MRLNYFTEEALQRIKNAVPETIDNYEEEKSWINNYFESDNWKATSKIVYENFELYPPDDDNLYDEINSKIVYNNLSNLNPANANDERLWSYLTHVKFWDYMRKRWPIENYEDDKIKRKAIIRRYFFNANSGKYLIRNGISRLWWFGYLTHDSESGSNKLVKLLLYRQDIAESILGRSFSNNNKITQTLLKVFDDRLETYGELPKRKIIRELCKHINYMGGVTILDSLNEEELREKINNRLIHLEKIL